MTFDEMIAEFGALGGLAENVRPGVGPHGKGLFVIDPAREVRIGVPAHLLIDTGDVALEDGRLIVRRDAAPEPAIRSFFERFEEHFSFGAGAAEEGRRVLHARHELPGAIQDHLLAGEPPEARRFPLPGDALLLRWFKDTRSVAARLPAEDRAAGGRKARRFLMPVMDLVNHSSAAAYFRTPVHGGVEMSGRFAGEVFFRYSMKDSWQKFTQWGFASDEPIAYSIPLDIGEPGGRILRVRGSIDDYEPLDGFAGPKIHRGGEIVALSHLVLGLRKAPERPRWLFRRLMAGQGIGDADDLFDMIAQLNRQWFLRLLDLLDDRQGEMIAEMRNAARLQLQALSCRVET
jgi:hypothetical protein